MKVDRLDRALRIFVTIVIYAIYIGLVFFSINGNYLFLFTFDYWFTTISTTALSLFLRWLYSDGGVEKELEENEKITSKENEKGKLIQEVIDKNLVDLLGAEIVMVNKEKKLEAYKNLCDKKIMFWKNKAWWKLGRKRLLNKWRNKKKEIIDKTLNIDIVKVNYYRYSIDEMLSTFYKDSDGNNNKRRTKNQKVINSTKSNVITILSIAILKGAEFLLSSFTREDLIVLGGQIIAFTMNIYIGRKLGKEFIRIDYSRNLSDDFVFLKTFLKKHKEVL